MNQAPLPANSDQEPIKNKEVLQKRPKQCFFTNYRI